MLIQSRLPCDSCGSSDAMSEYSDGTYCFSCQKYIKTSSEVGIENNGWLNHMLPRVPDTKTIRKGSFVYNYLMSLNFTDEMIFYYSLRETYNEESLVFFDPIAIEVKNLNFRDNGNVAKTVSLHSKKTGFLGKDFNRHLRESLPIIIVEDILSCMRVGWDNIACLALRGTKLSEELTALLCRISPNRTIVTWLDSDEPGQEGSKKIQQKLSWCGFHFVNIVTKKDPKWYTDHEIETILRENHVI